VSKHSSTRADDRRYSAPAAACAADLLQLLAKSQEPLPLAELARMLGQTKSLVFRVVRELESRGLVERRDGNRFALGIEALALGGAYISRATFRDPGRFVLRELAEHTGETANLALRQGAEVICVMKHEGEKSMVTFWHVGRRMPANCTAVGKILLAQLEDDEVGRLFDGTLPILTSRSIRTLERLLEELREVRRQGFAIDDGEAVLGRNCMAVAADLPGWPRGKAGLSVSMSAEEFIHRRDDLLERLRQGRDRLDREAAAWSALGHTQHEEPLAVTFGV
jgi:DNA-binding IclR family transcriptional regulator